MKYRVRVFADGSVRNVFVDGSLGCFSFVSLEAWVKQMELIRAH